MSDRVFRGRLLNERETARFLGVKPATLRWWRNRKHRRGPRYIKVGSAVRYRNEEIELYLKEQTVGMANILEGE
jgi:predicted DNA-binding transcriptional regulator AlpA